MHFVISNLRIKYYFYIIRKIQISRLLLFNVIFCRCHNNRVGRGEMGGGGGKKGAEEEK